MTKFYCEKEEEKDSVISVVSNFHGHLHVDMVCIKLVHLMKRKRSLKEE
jgi:hypothetical protein